MSAEGLSELPGERRGAGPAVRSPLAGEAWLGFGSNLGNRLANIERSLEHFSPFLVAVSPIFETSPWGIVEQPWFLNGVARLSWDGSPRELLQHCLDCEQRLGRIRGRRNGPRLIDLDVLMVATTICDEPGLTLPHPGLAGRRSVLEPWSLLAPDLVIPGYDCSLSVLRERSQSFADQQLHPFSAATTTAGPSPSLCAALGPSGPG